MKKKFLFFITILFYTAFTATAQSVYYFKYHFPGADDPVIYEAFLQREDDGSGFIRVSYVDDSTNETIWVDMEMQEGYETDKKGKVDSTKLFFEGYDPVIIKGDTTLKYNPDIFWFKLNESTGYYEPWDVQSPNEEEGTTDGGEYLESKLLGDNDLTKEFVSKFFETNDAFYENITETATTRSLSGEDKKTKMYLLIAANTEDIDIGATCEEDRKQTEKVFTDLAEFMGIQLVKKSLYGKEYSKQNTETAIQSLNPSPKDIVVFYYTGHGFSMPDNYEYPHIALTYKSFESAKANSLNMEEIYARIKKKGARFTLVVSDCCNTPVEKASAIIPVNIARTRNSQIGWNLDNCKTLFLNPKRSSVLMTAAARDELSCGISSGGLFTTAFRSSLTDFFSKFHNNVTWQQVLTEVKNDTIRKADKTARKEEDGSITRCKQHPVFKIQVD